MPKIIDNLKSNILDESMRIIEKEGIDNLKIRSLATSLHVAPSTIYNYFDGKDQIVGALLMRSWEDALARIDEICEKGNDAPEALSEIAAELKCRIRPLLQQHISAVTRQNSQTGFDSRQVVTLPLEERVIRILATGDRSEAEAKAMSSIITKLLITCMHDTDIELKEIIDTIKKL